MAKAQRPRAPGVSDAARIKELSKRLNDLVFASQIAVRDAKVRGYKRGAQAGFTEGLLCGILAAGLVFLVGGAGVLLYLGDLP